MLDEDSVELKVLATIYVIIQKLVHFSAAVITIREI